jgi:hypothetical protein
VRALTTWTDPLPFTPSCTPNITGGTSMTFAGQNACLTGCFPGFQNAFSLMLDGKTPLVPQAASQTTIVVRIPEDTPPQAHTIQWVSSLGATGSLPIDIFQLEGSINQNELWRGQSTNMMLKIVGSSKPLPLVVINRTPGTIDIQGGVEQTITTPGGIDNLVTRKVTGIHRGDFQIDYKLNYPICNLETAAPTAGR